MRSDNNKSSARKTGGWGNCLPSRQQSSFDWMKPLRFRSIVSALLAFRWLYYEAHLRS